MRLSRIGGSHSVPSVDMSRDLSRLRLFAIVAPVGFVFAVGYLVRGPFHHELHHYPGWIYLFSGASAGVLAFSFFVFALIERLERRVLEQNSQLGALLAVGQAASSSLRLDDMLDAALDAVLAVTSAETAEVWLLRDEELVLERLRGAEAEAFLERGAVPMGEGLPGLAAATGNAVSVHNLAAEARFARPRVVELGFRTYCALPLRRRQETVAVLGVAAYATDALAEPAEHRLLEGIGEQVAVAIDNARLHTQVLDAAVLEERERLGRELHDGLAQVLGYVNTQTLAIKKLLSSGRGDEAEQHVADMETTARRVYTDVREAILGLQTSHDELLSTLHAYIADYAQMTGIEAVVEVGADVEPLRLPPSAEIQLVRIVQEALANVRKHARAGRVSVRLQADGDVLSLEVADDGRGFVLEQPRRTGWPHFGLQTMRERAEAIGGAFELDSAPGVGTRVRVRVPATQTREIQHAGAAR
jgi:signal transduction histidine kinase